MILSDFCFPLLCLSFNLPRGFCFILRMEDNYRLLLINVIALSLGYFKCILGWLVGMVCKEGLLRREEVPCFGHIHDNFLFDSLSCALPVFMALCSVD